MATMKSNDATEQEQARPSESVVKQVKDGLEHLYDLSYLQKHPLAQDDRRASNGTIEIAGQRLRRELAAAVESMSPGPNVPFRAPQARVYNLLTLHYVEGVTVHEAAHKLGISRRQAHRDLRRGLESVAAVLQARRSAPTEERPRASRLSSVQAEMAHIDINPQPTDLGTLLRHVIATVDQLAKQQGVRLNVELPDEPVILSSDPGVTELVLVDVLSRAVGQACAGPFEVSLAAGGEMASLTLHYYPKPDEKRQAVVSLMVAQLADRLGWKVAQQDRADGCRMIALQLTTRGPVVLVIDDNEGLVNLLERYLTDQACCVVAATNGTEGLQRAQELVPDVIALDVMMPGMHGWDVLQRLRNQPQTADIPVIIISVFDNPDLAYSLGASLFLSKPVSRQEVLGALHQVGAL
jgi:CheY-like chemotaxis protein